jgi:hypothetical protein
MSTAQFASFDAIVFPDPSCVEGTQLLATAEANKSVWSAVITGPKIVLGTDPQFHRFTGQAQQLMLNGVQFAASGPGTGMYMALSCYYAPTPAKTPVSILSPFGSFLVETQNGCPSAISIVAPAHPAMAGLTNAGLSNWSCSMHEWFNLFPMTWSALAVDVTLSSPRTYIISSR